MDPRAELVLLAMLDHPHEAEAIADAYGRGDLDDLLAEEPAADDAPDPTPEPEPEPTA
jgi:hypothetical protein